ncbi:DDE superfamily endonuclease domain-containing protein [Phthorimaea operculella]|nr:DDE superfamily endonuclease domain-containing protein [Phthorimaea operculella]
MPAHLCHYWLGINSDQFYDLLNSIPNLAVPNKTIALCIYLVKVRTGDSNERLATLFNMARSTLERWMTTKVRNCFKNDFVPLHLGFNHIRVENVASRNRIIPEGFFGNPDLPPDNKPAIVLCDATYVFLQNSTNYLFQKETYSLQKRDNLIKPFMVVSCDGYIVECLGPYKATCNDAAITSVNLRHDESGFRSFFRQGDVFLLDRGFRDVINELREHGYVTHMPESLLEDQHQLTTQQANRSRMLTMCRWVVEVVNGWVKRDFRLFRYVFNNRAAMHLWDDFRICCALLNKFHVPIENPPEASEYVTIARSRLTMENHLANCVDAGHFNRRRVNFETIDSNHPHLQRFPQLTINDLKRFALGTYQIKQARSYYGEHVRESGIYSVEINNEIDEDLPLILGVNNYLLRGNAVSVESVQKAMPIPYRLIQP